MSEMILPSSVVKRLEKIYEEMEAAYEHVAEKLQFSCTGCPDNCCDSYFLHHTYIEWSYLWYGFSQVSAQDQQEIQEKAAHYVLEVEKALRQGDRPQVMCPLNKDGLCQLYKYRLMVCRTHGVPAVITRPDGKRMNFPGCFRCQEKVGENQNPPYMERTQLLRRLAELENEFLDNKRHLRPRVKLTIAEMLVKGAPELPPNVCCK